MRKLLPLQLKSAKECFERILIFTKKSSMTSDENRSIKKAITSLSDWQKYELSCLLLERKKEFCAFQVLINKKHDNLVSWLLENHIVPPNTVMRQYADKDPLVKYQRLYAYLKTHACHDAAELVQSIHPDDHRDIVLSQVGSYLKGYFDKHSTTGTFNLDGTLYHGIVCGIGRGIIESPLIHNFSRPLLTCDTSRHRCVTTYPNFRRSAFNALIDNNKLGGRVPTIFASNFLSATPLKLFSELFKDFAQALKPGGSLILSFSSIPYPFIRDHILQTLKTHTYVLPILHINKSSLRAIQPSITYIPYSYLAKNSLPFSKSLPSELEEAKQSGNLDIDFIENKLLHDFDSKELPASIKTVDICQEFHRYLVQHASEHGLDLEQSSTEPIWVSTAEKNKEHKMSIYRLGFKIDFLPYRGQSYTRIATEVMVLRKKMVR